MAVPVIESIAPSAGPASGGELVRIVASDLAGQVAIYFGTQRAWRVQLHAEAGRGVVDAWAPAHAPGAVDVVVQNLDANGAPVPGERATAVAGYRFVRPDLRCEDDVTRLVRALLRALKDQIFDEVHLSVAVDYGQPSGDGLRVTALASLPSLVLSGPQLRDNAFLTDRASTSHVVPGLTGDDILVRRPVDAFDLSFTLTGASDRSVELLNLVAAVMRFLDRNRWLSIDRDPDRPELGAVRFELDREGDTRTRMAGADGVHAFNTGLVIRGVPLVEGPPIDRTRRLTTLSL